MRRKLVRAERLTLTRFRLLPVPEGTKHEISSLGASSVCDISTYPDQRICSFQKMLFALRLGPFLMPVNDGLVRNAVVVVQYLCISTSSMRKR